MTGVIDPVEAEAVLAELASVFFHNSGPRPVSLEIRSSDAEARYRALVEQVPAIVFMAYLDEAIGEAYVSPQIEKTLGFTQSEWLEDPIRWYQQVHPEDKQRWSVEAAQMFLSGEALRSAYRVIARDGRVIWFHCEAKMIRRSDGRPWFIHGVAFDITELKRTEQALQEERNVLSAILDTAGALVVVLNANGRIVRLNRECERSTGYSFPEVKGERLWDLFMLAEERERFRRIFEQLSQGTPASGHEVTWLSRAGERRLINWSMVVLPSRDVAARHVIATGIDITDRKRLEAAVLEISSREQRRIGQDLHDGLGQHLTGIAFLSKVLEQKLRQKESPETADAAKIVNLVNEAIHTTRELAKGLLPVMSDARGLMGALQQWASEVEDLFQVDCRFECEDTVLVHDTNAAIHLYRVAQEAVHNAIKHGKPASIVIALSGTSNGGVLSVRDDGAGMTEPPSQQTGMGLHIMRYRAGMIGGTLEIRGNAGRGTSVICTFPRRADSESEIGLQ